MIAFPVANCRDERCRTAGRCMAEPMACSAMAPVETTFSGAVTKTEKCRIKRMNNGDLHIQEMFVYASGRRQWFNMSFIPTVEESVPDQD